MAEAIESNHGEQSCLALLCGLEGDSGILSSFQWNSQSHRNLCLRVLICKMGIRILPWIYHRAMMRLKIEIICQKCFAKGKLLYKFKGIQFIDCDCQCPRIGVDWLMGPGAKEVAKLLFCAFRGHQSVSVMPTAKQSPLCFLAPRSHHGLAPGPGLGKPLGKLQKTSQGSRRRKKVAYKAGSHYYYHRQK